MSEDQQKIVDMSPGARMGPKFMAVLLWCQKETCNCPGCEALREVANGMIESQGLNKETERIVK